jgi:heme-degrading monooxygenase HmoA
MLRNRLWGRKETFMDIKNDERYVVFVEWKVPAGRQTAFINAVADVVEQNFRAYKGFISSSFHRSDEGKRVINYAVWKSKQDWQEAFHVPGRDEATATIKSVIQQNGGKSLGAEGFRVERVIHANARK